MRKTEEATRWGWEGKRRIGRKGMWEGHGPACRSDISGRRVTFIKCSTNTLGLFACPYFITPLLSLLYRQFNLFFKEATMCLSCSSCSPSFIVLMSTSFFMPALIPAVSQGVYERYAGLLSSILAVLRLSNRVWCCVGWGLDFTVGVVGGRRLCVDWCKYRAIKPR